MKNHVTKWVLIGALLLFNQLSFAAELLVPIPVAAAGGRESVQLPTGHHALSFNSAAMAMKAGEEILLTLPNGERHVVVFDRKVTHASNGDESWVGHIKQAQGSDFRVVVTRGQYRTEGMLRTPSGRYEVQGSSGQERLVDFAAAKIKTAPFDIAPKIPTIRHRSSVERARETAALQALPGAITIDVAILYTDGMISKYGNLSSVRTRINHLVLLANQAYVDSNVGVSLRLVTSQKVAYPDNTSMDDALTALTASEVPELAAGAHPALASVKTLRDTYSADLVSMIRPYDQVAHGNICGLAFLTGYDGQNVADFAEYGYSVVSDGGNGGGRCDEYTFAHELGHNMGSAHDRANSKTQGAYPYSYGYGKDGLFGTIMSYIDPRVGKFSSPLITCAGQACGVADHDDNARSLNNTRFAVASFRGGAPAGAIQAQSGWWWNSAEPGRGYFIEITNGKVFMADFLYKDVGSPLWFVTSGTYASARFSGTLDSYSGGQTLAGDYKSPTGPAPQGSISVSFNDASHGTLNWPGGSLPITRFEIATGSLSAPAPTFQPETGWYWNAAEGGRGFAIEIQGNQLFMAGFMYDASGDNIWYVSGGTMTSDTFYQGTWQQCQGGQPMTGVFRPATCTDLANGAVALSFTSKTTAILLLPGGRQVPLTRFTF